MVLGVLVGLLRLFQAILLPFVLGFLAAYFLNPAVSRLEARGLPRLGGTALVSVVFLMGVLLCGLFVLPALFGQMQDLLMRLPALVGFLWDELLTGVWPRVEALALAWDLDLGLGQGEWQRELFTHVQDMAGFAHRGFRELLSGLGNVITLIGLLVLAPVVGIYFLYDYPSILKALEGLVPRRNLAAVRLLAGSATGPFPAWSEASPSWLFYCRFSIPSVFGRSVFVTLFFSPFWEALAFLCLMQGHLL